jgi:hypothetical protein
VSATTTEPGSVGVSTERYLAAVASALAGVPEPERQELLDDLAEHLAELAAEDGDALEVRLGPPEVYAAELVASAGLVTEPLPPDVPVSLARQWIDAGARRWHGERAAAIRGFLPELAPGWWLARAWCVVALLAIVNTPDQRRIFPLPEVVGNPLVSFVVLGAACVASVRIGRAGGWRDRVVTVVGVIGLLVAVVNGGDRTVYVTESGYEDGWGGYGSLVAPDGRVIQNIWPYDGDGQPIEVFLFDQDGRPIDVGGEVAEGTLGVPGLFPQPRTTWEYDPVTDTDREVPMSPPVVSIPQLPPASSTETTTTAPAEDDEAAS